MTRTARAENLEKPFRAWRFVVDQLFDLWIEADLFVCVTDEVDLTFSSLFMFRVRIDVELDSLLAC